MATLRQADPSRTAGIQRMFGPAIVRRLAALDKAIRVGLIDNDALGLVPSVLHFHALIDPAPHKVWASLDPASQQRAFSEWLGRAIAQTLDDQGPVPPWIKTFVRAAYTKGIQSATQLLEKNPEIRQAAESLLSTPFHRDRLEAIFERDFTELKGITNTMATKIQRALADGLAAGDNPKAIARRMTEEINITKNRARMLARTETVRTNAEAQLNTFERFGVQQVSVEAEWITAGFNVCPLCAANGGKIFTVEQARGMIPLHPNCLLGDAVVASSSRISAVMKRWYEGQVVTVRTGSGHQLSLTPNHPVLTDHGWVVARDLNKGSNVICESDWNPSVRNPHHYHMPTTIEKIADSFFESRYVTRIGPVPVSAKDFHGDGVGSDVCIVGTNRFLWSNIKAAIQEQFYELLLKIRTDAKSFSSVCANEQLVFASLGPANGNMCVHDLMTPLVGSHPRPFQRLGRTLSTRLDTGIKQSDINGSTRAFELIRERIHAFARQIQSEQLRVIDPAGSVALEGDASLSQHSANHPDPNMEMTHEILRGHTGAVSSDEIVDIDVRDVSGNVFNLETESGLYYANGIITHNCRCAWVPVVKTSTTDQAA